MPAGGRAAGQQPGGAEPRQELTVRQLVAFPELAAFVPRELDEKTVAGLARASGFTQRDPDDGAPPSVETEVYLGYDSAHLYIVFRAFDPEPSKIRAHLMPRDSLRGDDRVAVRLDTFGDQRRAYVFQSNPLGVQRDSTFTEGQRPDSTFDAVWESEGRVSDWGFVVRMAIPFRSLRFTQVPGQSWGIVLERDRPRDIDEEMTWPWVSSNVAGYLDQAAVLSGIEAKTRTRNYQAIPYGTFRELSLLESDDPRADLESQGSDFDIGADLKAVFRDRVVLDATFNPDFSQVESDEPQVTVNERFEVFFPERRPFFLENADFFETPVNLVFTRRILDPRFGARLTGKVGSYGVGALVTDDEGPGKRIAEGPGAGDRAHVGIARLRRDIGTQSTVGLLYTQRDFAGESNRVASVDGRFRFTPKWIGQAQFAHSDTDMPGDLGSSGSVLFAELERSGRFFQFEAEAGSIDEDFETDLGFVRRRDIREAMTEMSWRWRPVGQRLVNWGPGLSGEYRTDQTGLWLDRLIEAGIQGEWRSETELEIGYERGSERLRPGDADGVDRLMEFDVEEWSVEFGMTPSKMLEIEGEMAFAKTINFEPLEGQEPSLADELGAGVDFTFRPITAVRNDNTVFYTRLEDRRSGARLFEDWILRSRWNWQVSLPFSVRVILQWEETSANTELTSLEPEQSLNADLLLAYRFNPWTAIYLGYTENRSTFYETFDGQFDLRDRRDPRVVDRLVKDGEQVFFKVSYLLW